MEAMISVDTYRIDRRVAGVLRCESLLALMQCCGQDLLVAVITL